MWFALKLMRISYTISVSEHIYSRTSMTRTPMARLPRLFRIRSWVPRKTSNSCRHYYIWNNLGWFFIILILVYCVYSLEWGNSNENTQHTFIFKKFEKNIPIMPPDLALWFISLARTTPVSNIFSWYQRCSSYCTWKRFCLDSCFCWKSGKKKRLAPNEHLLGSNKGQHLHNSPPRTESPIYYHSVTKEIVNCQW